MTSLLALLSQQTPNLPTRKALIILGLQNDFNSSKGKLPVTTDLGYLDRISGLVPDFREHGDIIWVRSEYEANRPITDPTESGCSVVVGRPREAKTIPSSTSSSPRSSNARKTNDKGSVSAAGEATEADELPEVDEEDEELFLSRLENREPCCIKGSWGARYTEKIAPLIEPRDMQVTKSYYSAFSSTSLLMTLRSKLITELFVCGNMTNISVYATAMDAARYGIKITLVEDCLGYRKRERHDRALRDLVEIMEAKVFTSTQVVDVLTNPPESEEEEEDDDEESEDEKSVADREEETVRSRTAVTPGALEALEADSNDDDSEDDVARVRFLHLPVQARSFRKTFSGLQLADASSNTTQHARPAQHKRPSDPNGENDHATISSSPSHQGVARQTLGQKVVHSASSLLPDGQPHIEVTSGSTSPPMDKEGSSFWPEHAELWELGRGSQTHASDASEEYSEAQPIQRQIALFGDERREESEGSFILYDLLPAEIAECIFDSLKREINWQRMFHQTGEVPRLVCCQATTGSDGSVPVYRHPSDHTLPSTTWTPNVDTVRKAAEAAIGHRLNHALIQLYRGGTDFISEHSDKTLDIAPGSSIVNVSFGAHRVMRLRTKRANRAPGPASRTTYRVPLPHNSLLQMSLPTNAAFLHGIMPDKRRQAELIDEEKAYDGHRISLTFRQIGTFITRDSLRIWGQGAKGKTAHTARPVINGNAEESASLVSAFGAENRASEIEWEDIYGEGFDVLHLKGEPSGDGNG